jgi:hypothetical protein
MALFAKKNTPSIQPIYRMKKKLLLCSAIVLVLAGSSLVGCASEAQEQAALAAQAKVSQDAAAKTALAQVPGGTVREAELEKEDGKLIWSFDVVTPDSKDTTEVNIDAVTGSLVNIEKDGDKDNDKDGDKDNDKDKDQSGEHGDKD